ncbi:hypothetical protein ACI79U_04785 [Modestobacter sp. SYSU DS0904]
MLREPGRTITLEEFSQTVGGVLPLLEVGYWIGLRADYERFSAVVRPGPSAERRFWEETNGRAGEFIAESTLIIRATYASPLDILIALPDDPAVAGATLLGMGAACTRGIFYVLNQWQRFRVTRSATNYQVAALDLLRSGLPHPGQLPEGHLMPTLDDLERAGRLLPQIESAVNSQRILDANGEGDDASKQ